jgi:hypothetical protein
MSSAYVPSDQGRFRVSRTRWSGRTARRSCASSEAWAQDVAQKARTAIVVEGSCAGLRVQVKTAVLHYKVADDLRPAARERFLIANSWGEEFGDHGFCWLSAGYLAWGESDDFWMISRTPMFSDGVQL